MAAAGTGSKGGTGSNFLNNLSRVLPTGTFITFQGLAPIFTNNGDCGLSEKIVTGLLLLIFFLLCFILNFIDSITTESGHVYYGLVTKKGLYNPEFKKSKIAGDRFEKDEYFIGGKDFNKRDYTLQFNDFVNATLSVVTFGTLACLTPPITTCYYPDLSQTLLKTAPILVGMVVTVLFAVFPTERHGVGFSLSQSGFRLVPEEKSASESQTGAQTGSAESTNPKPDAEV